MKHRHVWVWGWQKREPSYRWTREQQWPDDRRKQACMCGVIRHSRRGWVCGDNGEDVTGKGLTFEDWIREWNKNRRGDA